MQTDRAKPVPFIESLKGLPVMLVSLFVVVGAVDLLLVIQPSVLASLRGDWQSSMPSGSGWATLLAASVIVGAIALAATTLTWFVRGVRAAPYLCLAPLWVGLCMLVIGRMQIELPLPLPTPAFVAICALVFVGSGVLFESRSQTNNAAGAALSALPILLLVLGYMLSSVRFDGSAMLLLFVLAVAAAGAPVIAFAVRSSGAKLSGGPSAAADEDVSEQLVELLERARQSEERAVRAERLLQSEPEMRGMMAVAPRLAPDEDELAMMRPRVGQGRAGWIAAGVVAAIAIGSYVFGVAPVSAKLAEQEQLNAMLRQKHSDELATLRASADREKRSLELQLSAAEQARQDPAAGTPTPAPGGSAAAALAALSGQDEDSSAPKRSKREPELDAAGADDTDDEEEAQRDERRAARRELYEQRKAERLAAREARRAERLAARAEKLAARKAARKSGDSDDDEEEDDPPAPSRATKSVAEPPPPALRDSAGSDDPLEGLDGL